MRKHGRNRDRRSINKNRMLSLIDKKLLQDIKTLNEATRIVVLYCYLNTYNW